MAFVVRRDVEMKRGKIASQCAHASIALYRKLLHSDDKDEKECLEVWEAGGMPKIVLKCRSLDTFLEIQEAATERNVPFVVIHDAGRTQVKPGTETVLAVGPAPIVIIDEITGHLKLL